MLALAFILFGLLLAGVPIGISLAGSAAAIVLFDDFLSFSTLFEAFFIFISKYTLIAIPFFIYAGFLMEKTGLVGGLFNFAFQFRRCLDRLGAGRDLPMPLC